SSTRKQGGVGLGLAICQQILRGMGGRMSVSSTPGKGSTFEFAVNFARQAAPISSSIALASDALRDLRVLVVDDNESSRQVLDQMLRKWSMKPALAHNGQQALVMFQAAAAEQRPYAVAIIDALMPGMDGP